jgi:uncharacterized protein (UPF0179 family)
MTKHLVCFVGSSFTMGKRITLCGQELKRPGHLPFFHDDPEACQSCIEKGKTTVGIKYPMAETAP